MPLPKLIKSDLDTTILELVQRSDHRVLGTWAGDCVERVLPCFEKRYPNDDRPRKAIEALREWVETGVFHMADVRRVSLASHAAAREVAGDDTARSVARSAGQAMATAHVKTHSAVAAIYAVTAVYYATDSSMNAVNAERAWQYKHLRDLQGE